MRRSGDLSVEQWLDAFLPGDDFSPLVEPNQGRSLDWNCLSSDTTEETKLYSTICGAVQNVLDSVAEKKKFTDPTYDALKVENICLRPEQTQDDDDCIHVWDAPILRSSDQTVFALDDDDDGSSDENNLDDDDAADESEFKFDVALSRCVALLRMEWNSDTDPLESDSVSVKPLFTNTDRESREILRRIEEYVVQVEYRQHLRFFFLVFVYRTTARFLIFDRDGGIKSLPFDYVENPSLFLTFFYRLAMANDVGRGRDPTVTTPSEDDVANLEESLKALGTSQFSPAVRDQIKDCLDPAFRLQHPIWQLKQVSLLDDCLESSGPDPRGRENYCFLIAKPQTPAPSLFERATKGYIAFNTATREFVFLKDSWRSEKQTPEYDTHRRLQNAGVPHIATLLCGGDVRTKWMDEKQITRTSVFFHRRSRIHTRLVCKEIGEPLRKFRNSMHLISAVLSSMIAHEAAWKVGVLHGDVSDSNIILIYSSAGNELTSALLIDWDLSKERKDIEKRQFSNNNQVGTWPFMSALRQRYPKRPHDVSDDIESFVHVIIWCALRYLPHNEMRPESLGFLFWALFEDCRESSGGAHVGCSGKWALMNGGPLPFSMIGEDNLQQVMLELVQQCQSHYATLNPEDDRKYQPSDTTTLLKSDRTSNAKPSAEDMKYAESLGPRRTPIRVYSTPKPEPIAHLTTHHDMLSTLFEAVSADGWPDSRNMERDNLKIATYVTWVPGPRRVSSADGF